MKYLDLVCNTIAEIPSNKVQHPSAPVPMLGQRTDLVQLL